MPFVLAALGGPVFGDGAREEARVLMAPNPDSLEFENA